MPRRTKLTNAHKDKISLSMKAYHTRVKRALPLHTKPQKPKPIRRITPVLVAPFVRHRAVALKHTMSKGQQTTAKRLSRLERRVKKRSGTDTAPWLGF